MTHRPWILIWVLVVVGAACSGSDDASTTAPTDRTSEPSTTVSATPAPDITSSATGIPAGDADVFSFADDDPCAWVGEDDVARLLATVFEWDGTLIEQPRAGSDRCEWTLAGDDYGFVAVSDAGRWEGFSGGSPFDWDAVDIVAYSDDELTQPEIGQAVAGHPALGDGVVVFNGGFGSYAFWVPPRQEYLAVGLAVPGVSDVFEDDRFFVFADGLVRELGWVN